MNDEIKEVNLELLIGLKQHLDQANQLRTVLDRLLALAKAQPPANCARSVSAAPAGRRREAAGV
jgi:hypothetical protein